QLTWRQLYPNNNPSPLFRYSHLGLVDPVNDRMLIAWGWRANEGLLSTVFRLQWYQGATATAISLLAADPHDCAVYRRWQERGQPGMPVRRERPEGGGSWTLLAQQSLDGSQEVSFVDRDVRPGERIGYRLSVANGDAGSEIAWVDVPAAAALALYGFEPNPAISGAQVVFSLPSAGIATLDLLDVGGRSVTHQELSARGGRNTVAIDAALSPGLYFIRLRQGGRELLRRGTVMR